LLTSKLLAYREILRCAAVAEDGTGGHPARVGLDAIGLSSEEMQTIAAQVGNSRNCIYHRTSRRRQNHRALLPCRCLENNQCRRGRFYPQKCQARAPKHFFQPDNLNDCEQAANSTASSVNSHGHSIRTVFQRRQLRTRCSSFSAVAKRVHRFTRARCQSLHSRQGMQASIRTSLRCVEGCGWSPTGLPESN
jgi:hypothetical protein